jgi:hypothetical protein
MTLPNDSIPVTPGSGAVVATHTVSSKEYQAVVLADADGHLKGSNAAYRLLVPGSAVGANKVHLDFWNGDAALVLKILSVKVLPDIDTAVTGVVSAEVALTRTTAIGTGGTAAALESTSLTAAAINKLDTASPALDADITARAAPTAGATGGTLLGIRHVFTEETNAGAALAAAFGAEFIDPDLPIYVRPNSGLRMVQGAVASVGVLNFEITFEVIA